MKQLVSLPVGLLGLLTLLLLSGCQPAVEKNNSGSVPENPPNTVDVHPEHGPHKGELIELGKDHKYHAELLHDEKKGTVTIYLLGGIKDGKVEDPVYTDSKEVVINLKHDGKPEQFKLKGVPDENPKAPEGKFSKFFSDDKELAEDLDHKGAEPRLVVIINGTSYTGNLEHDHDHGDHKH